MLSIMLSLAKHYVNIAVFLPASPFINLGDFCQPRRLLHSPRLLF